MYDLKWGLKLFGLQARLKKFRAAVGWNLSSLRTESTKRSEKVMERLERASNWPRINRRLIWAGSLWLESVVE